MKRLDPIPYWGKFQDPDLNSLLCVWIPNDDFNMIHNRWKLLGRKHRSDRTLKIRRFGQPEGFDQDHMPPKLGFQASHLPRGWYGNEWVCPACLMLVASEAENPARLKLSSLAEQRASPPITGIRLSFT